MKYLLGLALAILSTSPFTFANGLEPATVSPLLTLNQSFLNKPLLYPQIMEKGRADYYRYVYNPIINPLESEKQKFTVTLSQLRHPYNSIAMNRFDQSLWVPELLEKAKNDPWTDIDDEVYDFDVDEVELISVIRASTTCVFNAFKKFDIYATYVKDGYFIYSYELSEEEVNALKLQPAENNELYHYNIFYPSSLIGTYQSIIKYQMGSSHYEIVKDSSIIRVPQLTIAWKLLPVENLSSLPGRGDKISKSEERAWREEISGEMSANSGYVVFEPLVLNGELYGEYEECSMSDNKCEKKQGAKAETLAHGIFYLKPDIPLGEYPFVRQNIMDSIMNALISGFRASIADATKGKIIRTIDGTWQPLKIGGCE